MNKPAFVLDASAVLCLLFREAGADRVLAELDRAVMSSVNYAEVLGTLIDRGIDPQRARSGVDDLDFPIVGFDLELAASAALLRSKTRDQGLSLGDRACLALALQEKAIALTADQAWSRMPDTIGIEIEQIR